MNKLREIMGQVLLSGAFLVRQYDDDEKTLFAGIMKSMPFKKDVERSTDEIWVAQLIIPEPRRYCLKGSRYEGWELSDIIQSEIKLSDLTKIE